MKGGGTDVPGTKGYATDAEPPYYLSSLADKSYAQRNAKRSLAMTSMSTMQSACAAAAIRSEADTNGDTVAPAHGMAADTSPQPKRRRIRGKQPPRPTADEGRIAGPACQALNPTGASPSPTLLLSAPAVGSRGNAPHASDIAHRSSALMHDLDSAAADVAVAQPRWTPRSPRARLHPHGAAAHGRTQEEPT